MKRERKKAEDKGKISNYCLSADNVSAIPWRFNSSLEDTDSILPKLRVPLQVREDGFEVKVLWVVGGLSTRVTDVSLLKEEGGR